MAEKKTKTEELLEKISENLEGINKGIETNKERKLQIDIAKLQAEEQEVASKSFVSYAIISP